MDRLIETRHVAAVDYRDVTAAGQQHDDPNRWLFLPQTSGGSVALPSRSQGQPGNQLYWHLHNHTTSTLTLAEVSLSNGQTGQGVQLHIPGQVFSALALESQQLLLLIGTKAGASHVVAYGRKDWAYQGRCQLLQQRGSADWGMKEELWCSALEAANPSSSSSSNAAASQVLGQLLVPGQLCLSSLAAALAYHGAQMSEAEAAAASLSQLQGRISAAVQFIQARFPAYSPARCWHALFASYCEAWQQQHALLGLFGAAGGWLGVVRAGGLLSVLRRPSAPEVLLAESNIKALGEVLQVAGAAGSSRDARPIPGGAAELAKVRLCLSMLGELLGQPAMRVMTQAVMAGVSVEGELLPRFLELLLQGPPAAAAAASGSSGASVLAGGVAARLAEWRLQRQAQLLAVQEQLAELPYPLETLR
ncbi:hypothetical protein OEZ85_003556 [Tetradesmus obliquus]|uniref:Anaphase-promoting complex subunit 1 n=1 Tax=Tetradesmus obliquus TaxID=3088 RepID=A0ABY8UBP8_TETOB|nr:hypothetical protein OEZ85_003556 [Tetradesmus obliquus]